MMQGLLRIEIELVPEFPHAKTVLVTFLEKPIIDFKYEQADHALGPSSSSAFSDRVVVVWWCSIVPLKSVNIMEIPGLAQVKGGGQGGPHDDLTHHDRRRLSQGHTSGRQPAGQASEQAKG